jgi:hypothetical protein
MHEKEKQVGPPFCSHQCSDMSRTSTRNDRVSSITHEKVAPSISTWIHIVSSCPVAGDQTMDEFTRSILTHGRQAKQVTMHGFPLIPKVITWTWLPMKHHWIIGVEWTLQREKMWSSWSQNRANRCNRKGIATGALALARRPKLSPIRQLPVYCVLWAWLACFLLPSAQLALPHLPACLSLPIPHQNSSSSEKRSWPRRRRIRIRRWGAARSWSSGSRTRPTGRWPTPSAAPGSWRRRASSPCSATPRSPSSCSHPPESTTSSAAQEPSQ